MEFLSNCIADFYISKGIIDAEDKDVYKCGLELILNDIVTFTLIMVISALLWKWIFAVEYLIVFCTTRVHCGGYHAPKAYICRLTMITTFVLVALLSVCMQSVASYVPAVLAVAATLMIVPLIPVKHPNKTLTEEMIKNSRKKGIMLYIIYSVCSVVLHMFVSTQDGMIVAFSLCAVTALAIIGKFVNERGEKQ